LDGGQKQADKNADNSDDDEQFNQRKRAEPTIIFPMHNVPFERLRQEASS
jgi:hypothetical protein